MSAPEYIVKQKWQRKHYILAVLLGLISLSILVLLGYYLGNRHSLQLISQNQELLTLSESQAQLLDTVENELVMQRQLNKVEEATNAEAGQSMEQQYQTIRELQRELGFYRSILAPQESVKGLQVSQFQWQKLEQDKIKWQISLLQAGSTGRMLSGLAKFYLIFNDNGTETRQPVLNSNDKTEFGFKFRYFQNITGELDLPAQGEPLAFEIEAKQYGQGQKSLTKRFPWKPPQESTTDVE
ncbi:MAG: hypothetical protein KJO69_08810 [Gammaproteobacteria bacterium]|nr:hypothetical protein [Gammaproteobacteria bacterium]